MALVPTGIEKIKRSQFLSYLNTTPSGNSATWKILGVGITDYGIDFNPQVDTEKWIIEDNARTDHSSNQKQGSVTQKCYKGDDVFEFVQAGRDKSLPRRREGATGGADVRQHCAHLRHAESSPLMGASRPHAPRCFQVLFFLT